MSEINYKVKYEQLKLKFMSSMDMAYRLGFEDGAKDAQMTQMAEQQQAQEQAAQAAANGFGGDGEGGDEEGGDGEAPGAPGQPDQDDEEGGEQPEIGGASAPGMEGEGTKQDDGTEGLDGSDADPDAPPVEGSELEGHISELEQMMMGKTEVSVEALKKSLAGIKAFKQARDLHKSMKAIKEIGKSLNKKKKAVKLPKKVFAVGKQASSNLTNKDKAALNVQEKIVSDIMKSWEEQEQKASKKIAEVLNVEGLVKKE